jgi:hypothetical protein
MTPQPHVCCVCKREVVWTDCLPVVCYLCRDKERRQKAEQELPKPTAVVAGPLRAGKT